MGHDFAKLKDYADKMVKFKQDVLMDQARNRGFMNQNFDIVSDGACAAYTMTWIKDKLLGGDPVFFPGPYNGPNNNAPMGDLKFRKSVVTAARGLWGQLKYKKAGAKWQHFGMALDELASDLGLEFATDNLDELDEAFGPVMDVINHFSGKGKGPGAWKSGLKPTEAAYIALSLENNKGHAVGLFRPYTDTFHFFDPNVGEYRIPKAGTSPTDQFKGFFLEYQTVLKEKLGWNLSEQCLGMRVRRRT
jgi:hypothetical protein